MAQIQSLPQETVEVDNVQYVVTAMPATAALAFQEKQMQKMVDEKSTVDLSDIKQMVCKYVSIDGTQLTSDKFDIHFARKTGHLHRLFEAVLDYNFPKEGNDSEE